MRKPGKTRGEVAIVVGDRWQGQGIGKILLQRSVRIAKDLGMRSIWGIVSLENKKLLAMVERLGFSSNLDPEAGLYEIEMDLSLSNQL